MTEMNRLRIFEEDEKFFIRRKVRNDCFPVIGKDGKELCADNYYKAVYTTLLEGYQVCRLRHKIRQNLSFKQDIRTLRRQDKVRGDAV